MNKTVIASISLLVAGVIIGVVVCIICLTTVEWQKAFKANKMHNANRQIAAKVSTGSDTGTNSGTSSKNNLAVGRNASDTKGINTHETLHVAHASTTPIDPATRTVVPNILHQAIQTSPTQGQFVDAGMTSNGMVAGSGIVPSGTIQVMPTTYIIQPPPQEIIIPGSVGPNRAVNSADAIPMPIGANGLQQNPCVDPSSSYGRAYNRESSY